MEDPVTFEAVSRIKMTCFVGPLVVRRELRLLLLLLPLLFDLAPDTADTRGRSVVVGRTQLRGLEASEEMKAG